jgi:hypothetical protein
MEGAGGPGKTKPIRQKSVVGSRLKSGCTNEPNFHITAGILMGETPTPRTILRRALGLTGHAGAVSVLAPSRMWGPWGSSAGPLRVVG